MNIEKQLNDVPELHDESLEKCLIGAMILDNSLIPETADLVKPEDYFFQNNQMIHSLIVAMYNKENAVDLILIHDYVKRHKLDHIDIVYIASCIDVLPPSSEYARNNVAAYRKRLLEYSNKRKIRSALQNAVDKTSNGVDSSQLIRTLKDTIEEMEREIAVSAQSVLIPTWESLDVAEVLEWKFKPFTPVIDGMIGQNQLIWNGADSQAGKTLFSLYLSLKLISGGKLFNRFNIVPLQKILYLVLEDPKYRIHDRILDYGLPLPDPNRFIVKYWPGFLLHEPEHFKYLRKTIINESFNFVIIDTWQAATAGLLSFDDATQTPLIRRLANTAREFENLTFFVNDHLFKTLRKGTHLTQQDIKGSGAKVQNSDCYMLMGSSGVGELKLFWKSKDCPPQYLLLDVSKAGSGEEKYTLVKDLIAEKDQPKEADTERLKWISETKPTTHEEIRAHCKFKTLSGVTKLLDRLCNAGFLNRDDLQITEAGKQFLEEKYAIDNEISSFLKLQS